jgi:hypothetical protein
MYCNFHQCLLDFSQSFLKVYMYCKDIFSQSFLNVYMYKSLFDFSQSFLNVYMYCNFHQSLLDFFLNLSWMCTCIVRKFLFRLYIIYQSQQLTWLYLNYRFTIFNAKLIIAFSPRTHWLFQSPICNGYKLKGIAHTHKKIAINSMCMFTSKCRLQIDP